jgi:hypothetical protein
MSAPQFELHPDMSDLLAPAARAAAEARLRVYEAELPRLIDRAHQVFGTTDGAFRVRCMAGTVEIEAAPRPSVPDASQEYLFYAVRTFSRWAVRIAKLDLAAFRADVEGRERQNDARRARDEDARRLCQYRAFGLDPDTGEAVDG